MVSSSNGSLDRQLTRLEKVRSKQMERERRRAARRTQEEQAQAIEAAVDRQAIRRLVEHRMNRR
jgi:hypothetical protein